MNTMLRLILCSVFVGGAFAQVPVLLGCPKVETMPSFLRTRFLGKWYEIERYLTLFQLTGKCVTSTYSLHENGTMKIINNQISSLNGISSKIEAYVEQREPEKAKLSVVFPSLPYRVDAPYWILDTDYKNYAVVWSCSDYGLFSTQFAWILARTPTPTVEILETSYKALDKNGISRAFFIRTDQKNCPADT